MDDPIRLDYDPREPLRAFHARPQRYACLVTHRRFGKTVGCIYDMILRASQHAWPIGTNFAYIAPTAKQAKMVVWTYLKVYAAPFLTGEPNETSLHMDLRSGARIHVLGAENAENLRGIGLAGCVLDEMASFPPNVWQEIVRPMLSDRGGWATFIGTPRGRNEFHRLYETAVADPGHWFSLLLTADQSGILPQHELDDLRATMTAEQYAQEYECSFTAAIMGAYFGKEMAEAETAGRIKDRLDRIDGAPVHTAWDLGSGDHMAIWCFQIGAGEIRVIDFLQDYGHSMVEYCADLDARGYHGTDFVPHDARVPSLETGRTRIETLLSHGRKPALVANHHVDDGINAVRLTFPRLWFDGTQCKDGIEALRQYRADYDEKAKVFRTTPKKDWSAHAADGMRYLCMAWRELVLEPSPPPESIFKPLADMSFDEFDPMHESDFDHRRRERHERI